MNGGHVSLTPNPEGPPPPLPDPIPFPEPPEPPFPHLPHLPERPELPRWPPIFRPRSVRCGCYLVNYSPIHNPRVTYDGTIRVECHNEGRTASGDLYQRRSIVLPFTPALPRGPGVPPWLILPPRVIAWPPPNPAAGIPIFSRSRYRYYLRITQILERWTLSGRFDLGFEKWPFDHGTKKWTPPSAYTARMAWTTSPGGYPSPSDYLSGEVKNSTGSVVGTLTMGWVSKYLRRATIEVDRVAQSEAALSNGGNVDWRAVGDGIDWDLAVDESDANVAEPSGEFWSDAECHASMLARRDASNLDAEWRYHVLCVRRLDSTPRGIMYDNGATDSNNVPREGCAISSHWVIPNTADWGLVQGVRFGAAAMPYFRTAVHEAGHAMGLYHNTADNGFMNTTDTIAGNATQTNPFPNNVQWSYATDDRKRLRHMPDQYVRPGGTPFGTSYSTTPISPTDLSVDAPGLELRVTPVLGSVPLGAPVRVNVTLRNGGHSPLESPQKLSLGSGFVKGQVTDPAGTVRTFSPLVLCVDHLALRILDPGESVSDSLTLLRGAQGALFPAPGLYTVAVEARWDVGGVELTVAGETRVMVTPVVDYDHAEAARKVLTTPDILLTVVLGGDHLEAGIAAIQIALENRVLRPHYVHLEAKRLAERFGNRRPNLRAAAELIAEPAVLSPAETRRARAIGEKARDKEFATAIQRALKSKLAEVAASDELQRILGKE